MDETLYHAWERYNDLLFRCPQHKSEQLSEAQALKLIQVMADHSHNWYDGETTRENINDSSDNVDTKKLKENIHAIQVGSLEETIIKYYDELIKKQATNDEWIRKFIENMDLNLRALDTTIKNLQVKADQLTRMVLTNAGERVKAEMKMGKKDMKEPVPYDLPVVQPYIPPTPFPGHLKKQNDNPYKTRKTVCTIGIPEKIHKKELRRMKGTRMMEVDINKKTENQAKMTKLSMEWKRLCKIKAKVQKCQSQSQYRRISSQTGAGTEEYYWMQS
ncbi:hypothetical protein Tco_1506837 [Tanacetum coccineum]